MTPELSILQSAVADNPLASAALKALVERAEKAEGEAAKLREAIQAAEKFIDGSIEMGSSSFDEPPSPRTQWDYDASQLVCHLWSVLNDATAGRELLERMRAMREGLVQVQSMAADLLEDQDAILKPLRAIYDVATSALGVPSAVEHESADPN